MRPMSIAMLAAWSGCALASDAPALPDYHADDRCRAQSKSIAGTASSPVDKECAKSEQEAYDNIQRYWPKLDAGQKTKCIAASSSAKIGNYRILQQCLARDALRVDGQAQPDLKK